MRECLSLHYQLLHRAHQFAALQLRNVAACLKRVACVGLRCLYHLPSVGIEDGQSVECTEYADSSRGNLHLGISSLIGRFDDARSDILVINVA